uniref:Uncharacterized protein n=1 Tax=Caenorhabditis japonica TaxID=281687 RepID=A0A8R1IL36_CAEJA
TNIQPLPYKQRIRIPSIEELVNSVVSLRIIPDTFLTFQAISPYEDFQNHDDELEDVAPLYRTNRRRRGLWKKMKDGLKKVGKGVNKVLKKYRDKIVAKVMEKAVERAILGGGG